MRRQSGETRVLGTVGGRAGFPPSSLSRGGSWLRDSCPGSQLRGRPAGAEGSARSSTRSCPASSSAIVSSGWHPVLAPQPGIPSDPVPAQAYACAVGTQRS